MLIACYCTPGISWIGCAELCVADAYLGNRFYVLYPGLSALCAKRHFCSVKSRAVSWMCVNDYSGRSMSSTVLTKWQSQNQKKRERTQYFAKWKIEFQDKPKFVSEGIRLSTPALQHIIVGCLSFSKHFHSLCVPEFLVNEKIQLFGICALFVVLSYLRKNSHLQHLRLDCFLL